MMAESLNKKVGDMIELSGSRFKVVGILESGIGWEEMGGVITLRDAQNFVGRPRKVTLYSVNLFQPSTAESVAAKINQEDPDIYAALSGEFMGELPDMKAMDAMFWAISLLTIIVGGLGVMNTMLMSVLERTREIGVLRALGWRQGMVLGMIMRESLLLGVFGGMAGILVAFLLGIVFAVHSCLWHYPDNSLGMGFVDSGAVDFTAAGYGGRSLSGFACHPPAASGSIKI